MNVGCRHSARLDAELTDPWLMMTSGNGPGPAGRNTIVRIGTALSWDGTSQSCARNSPCSGPCGPRPG
jgi:hypothetical protein